MLISLLLLWVACSLGFAVGWAARKMLQSDDQWREPSPASDPSILAPPATVRNEFTE
jgi:hypothetical protein